MGIVGVIYRALQQGERAGIFDVFCQSNTKIDQHLYLFLRPIFRDSLKWVPHASNSITVCPQQIALKTSLKYGDIEPVEGIIGVRSTNFKVRYQVSSTL